MRLCGVQARRGFEPRLRAAPFQSYVIQSVYALACFRVRLAFLAAFRRADAPRLRAQVRACLEREAWDAAEWPSFFRAFEVARDRRADGLRREWLWPLR